MSLEYRHFNNESAEDYLLNAHVVWDFLYSEIFPPEDSAPLSRCIPRLYGVKEDDKLIAAATLHAPMSTEEHFSLGLIAVAHNRRNEGIGGELLTRVEAAAVELGSAALVLFPARDNRNDYPADTSSFFARHGYIKRPNLDYPMIKELRSANNP